MATPAYLRYANQDATRNLPLSPELASALGFLPELGITAEVFSGGQAAKGSGGPRTGSVRHDHGNAADVRFYRDGRQLDWANPDDLPLFQEIVRRGKANGITGIGAGPNYMSRGSMHLGFGAPGVWGAGGRSANAPDWLREAYGAAPAGSVPAGSGQETLYGGAGNDDLSGGSMPQNPMPNNPGGLGGLGGFVRSPAFGDWLTAVGTSMMSSGSDAPLENFGTAFANQQAIRSRRDAQEAQQAEAGSQRMALKTLLRSQGYSEEEAEAYSHNASAAGLAMDQRKEARAAEEQNMTRAWLREKYPDLEGLPVQDAIQVARSRMTGNGEGRYSTQPQYFRRADGSVGIGQLSSTGEMVETALPEGSEILSPYDMSFDRARGGAAGKTGGEALGNLPQAEGTAARVLRQVEDLKNDPYLGNMVGPIDSRLPNWSADAARVQGKMNQLQSGAFLEARTALKGGGAITDFESKKAEDAYLRANAAQNEKDYKEALDEFAYYTQQGLAKLRQQAGAAAPAASPPAPSASSGGIEAMSDAELEAIANGR